MDTRSGQQCSSDQHRSMTTANELKWLIALLHGLPQTDIAEDNNEWHKRLPAGVSS